MSKLTRLDWYLVTCEAPGCENTIEVKVLRTGTSQPILDELATAGWGTTEGEYAPDTWCPDHLPES